MQHRQHRPRPRTLAADGAGRAGELCALRWLHHLPRHRYAGLFGGGAVLPHPECGQADHPHRCPAAHLQRDHRCEEKPARQRHLRAGPRQPGRDGGVRRACHRGHPRQEEQDHQLRCLCVGQFPGAGAGAGRPAGAVYPLALAHRPGGVWPGTEPQGLSAQADARPWPGAHPGHFSTIRLRHRGKLRRGRHPAAAHGRLCRESGRLRQDPQDPDLNHTGHLRGQRCGHLRGRQAGPEPVPLPGSPRHDHRGRRHKGDVAAGPELRELRPAPAAVLSAGQF